MPKITFCWFPPDKLEKVAAGSTVVDYIGKDFDFVNDSKEMSLKAGNDTLRAEKIEDTTIGADDAHYGFGKKADNTYRFELIYKKADAADSNKEKLILKINETVYPKTSVTLNYKEKLVNVPTAAGTHVFNTNESATLHPVDANGKAGDASTFPIPQVEYVVEIPNPPAPTPTPKPEPNPVPTTTKKKTTVPKTGDYSTAAAMGIFSVAAVVLAAWGLNKVGRKQMH